MSLGPSLPRQSLLTVAPPSRIVNGMSDLVIPDRARSKPSKDRALTSRQKAFVASYAKDGNASTAYAAAGYILPGKPVSKRVIQQRAYAVLHCQGVARAIDALRQAAIDRQEAARVFAVDYIVEEHRRLQLLAESKGDLAVATRNLELIGRTRGAYSDSVQVDVARAREFSESERVEAARLSRLLLLGYDVEGPAAGRAGAAGALPPGRAGAAADDLGAVDGAGVQGVGASGALAPPAADVGAEDTAGGAGRGGDTPNRGPASRAPVPFPE